MEEIVSSYKDLLKARGICIVMPTYNNAGTIDQVVRKCLVYCNDVIVVNDGCTDKTTEILSCIDGITVIEYERNRGKGYALKRGLKKARSMGFAYAITIDADGQHYPEDINKFLKANVDNPGTLILGERILENVKRSKGSAFANRFSNFWFFVQTGHHLKDTQTGYRLYPLKKLYGLRWLTSRYESELELLVFSSWHGVKLISIPINVYYPPKEQRVSHFRPGMDFARISLLNTVLCALAVIYGLPLRITAFLVCFSRTLYTSFFFSLFSLFVVCPLVYLYTKIGKMDEKKRQNLHKLIRWISKFTMLYHGIPGTKFSYKVSDNACFDKPSVIICNHQSHFDLTCQLIFSPNIVFLTKDWVWNNPFYGIVIRNAEFYPVSEGLDKLMPKLRSLIDRGYSIAIYPEGTRSKDCKIGRFHQGAFYVAKQLGVDILPMYLYGTGKVLPKGDHYLHKGHIRIEVGERISTEQLSQYGDFKRQASVMRKEYIHKYMDICNRMEQDA